jgi:hypothetical protein
MAHGCKLGGLDSISFILPFRIYNCAMKSKILSVVCLFVLVASFSLFAYAQDKDRTAVSLGAQIRTIFGGYTCNIFCFIALSVGGVAAIVIIFSGFTYLTSTDYIERDEVKKRIIYVFAGLILFGAMIPVVNYLTGMGSTNLSPFGCNCLNNSIEMAEPVVLGTTLPGLNVFIVKPKNGQELEDGLLQSFQCIGYGGTQPYNYKWTSDRDGAIGFADSFMTVELTDSLGNFTSAKVHVIVIVPKPRPN